MPTISQEKEEPPFSNEPTEDNHQHEVEHDAFTQHPGENSQEKVVQQSCYKYTGSLKVKKQCLQLTIKLYYVNYRTVAIGLAEEEQ